MRFQKRAPAYMGRKAAVQSPKKIAVAVAIMLVGRIYARITLARIVTAIPSFVTAIVFPDFPFIRYSL